MNIANESELDKFIKQYPDTKMMEILMPDVKEFPEKNSQLFFVMA